MDISEYDFGLRKGYEWDAVAYVKLIEGLCDLDWTDRDLKALPLADISQLTSIVYPKWSEGRRKYEDSLIRFFEKYETQVHEDCQLYLNDCDITPPELKNLRDVVEKIIGTLMIPNMKEKSNRWMTSADRDLHLNIRKAIAQSIVDPTPVEEYDKCFRKVNRVVSERKDQILDIIRCMRSKEAKVIDNVAAVRRSSRLTTLKSKEPEAIYIREKIRLCDESGFKKIKINTKKGYGVIAMRQFRAGEFLLEYAGELMSKHGGEHKHKQYSRNPNVGSFIFDFKFNGKLYSVDATFQDTHRLGRLLNHSRMEFNAKVKALHVLGRPRLLFFAAKDINIAEEILYDYGDRDPETIKNHPWLNK